MRFRIVWHQNDDGDDKFVIQRQRFLLWFSERMWNEMNTKYNVREYSSAEGARRGLAVWLRDIRQGNWKRICIYDEVVV